MINFNDIVIPLFALLDAFTLMLMFNCIIYKTSLNKNLMTIGLIFVASFINDELHSNLENTKEIITLLSLMTVIIIISIINTIYKQGIAKSLTSYIILFVIQVIFQSIALFIDSWIHIDSFRGAQFIGDILCIGFVLLYRNKLRKINTSLYNYNDIMKINISNKVKTISLIALSITFLIITSIKFTNIGSQEKAEIWIIAIPIILLIVSSYYTAATEGTKMKYLTEKAEMAKVHNEFVSSINNFCHSYNNMLQLLEFYTNCDDISQEELKATFNDILKWNKENRISYDLQFMRIPNHMLAAILSVKAQYANEFGVKIKAEHTGNRELLDTIVLKNLIDTLNVVLDNAIEAAAMSSDKSIYIDIELDQTKVIFTCENRYDIDNEGNILKAVNSKGIGLNHIRELVSKDKHSTIEIDNNKEEKTFKIKIEYVGETI